jgi:hypothetical protein
MKKQLCTLVVRREKRKKKIQTINHRWQSNHDMYTRAALYGRMDGCVSSEMVDDKI